MDRPLRLKVGFFLAMLATLYCVRRNAVVVALLLFVFSVLSNVYLFQDQLLYATRVDAIAGPVALNPQGFRSPAERGLSYESVVLRTRDGVDLRGWFIPSDRPSLHLPTVLFLHGNAGNVGTSVSHYASLVRGLPANLLAVDYRGYGDSAGSPSEAGLESDAEAMLEYLRSREDVDPKKLVVFGRSLGGAVGVWLAWKHPEWISSLILESTFTSVADMASHLLFPPLRLLGAKLDWFLFSRWNTESRVGRIAVPPSLCQLREMQSPAILHLYARNDSIVPLDQHERLGSLLLSQRSPHRRIESVCFESGDHNTLPEENVNYVQTWKSFLEG